MHMDQDNIQKKLAQALQQQLKAETISLRQSSRDNVVFQMKTTDFGNFIARVSLTRSLAEAESEALFITHLAQHSSVPVAQPLQVVIVVVGESELPVTLFPFISYDSSPVLTQSLATQAGSLLAQIHTASSDFLTQHSFQSPRSLTADIESFRTRFEADQSPPTNLSEIIAAIHWAENFVLSQPETNKPLIIHNDYRPNNVLCSDGKVAAIIDFDWSVETEFWQKDVAQAALEWSMPDGQAESNMALFEAMIKGYCDKAAIEMPDLRDWIRFTAVTDAIHYWLHSRQSGGDTSALQSYMYDKYLYFSHG